MRLNTLYTLAVISTSSAFGAGFVELADTQTFINEQLIHQLSQAEIEKGHLSNDTLKLIKSNKNLIDEVERFEKTKLSQPPCDKLESSEQIDPPKKKTRTKKNHGWVIISSTEVTQHEREPEYQELIKPPLLDVEYDSLYEQLRNANSATDLQNLVKQQTQGMNENELFSYLAAMSTRLPYNYSKARFNQKEAGVDDFFSQISEDRQAAAGTSDKEDWGGICGDVHFATVLMGEAAQAQKYDFFTASYVIQEGLHVSSFAVSKEDPNKAFVINYFQATQIDNITGVDSIVPRNTNGRFNNIGANVRIFANTSDSLSGQAEHIATLPAALGRYIEQAHTLDHQRANIPQTNNGMTNQINFRNESTITKANKDRTKTIEIAQGVRLLQGSLQNEDQAATDVFSIAVYKQRSKNTDGQGNIIDSKRVGSESNVSLSTSHVSSDQTYRDNKFMFVRFNYYKGIHKSLISSEAVKVQANAGINFNADYTNQETYHTGDANFQPHIGLSTKIKTSNTSTVSSTVKATGAIGLKEERSVFQMSTLPSNLKVTTNVLEARARYDKKIGNDTFSAGAGVVSTQVGGLYNLFSSYQISTSNNGGKHFINIDYTKPTKGFNKEISANLLPVNEQTSLMYGIKKGRVEAGGTLTYDIERTDFYVGGKLKVNILRNKKTAPKSSK